MTYLAAFAAYMLTIFVIARIVGAAGRREASDLHDGATMRAEHRERHLRIVEQADAAAEEFRRGAS